MPERPAISVVIPLYNKADTIERALKSVLGQTDQDFEIIVVDDGSTDQSLAVVQAVPNPRLRVFHREHEGVSAARNLGISESRAEWVAFLDADDEWHTDHLETLSGLRKRYAEADVCATRYLFGVEGLGTRPATIRGLPADWRGVMSDYFSVAARSDPPLCASAVAVRREAIGAIGGFPVGVTAGEDLLTWARLAVRGRIAYSMKPTAVFWQAPGHVHRAKPTRMPDPDDVVGRGLESLLLERRPDQKAGLRKYIALWHKMRSSIYMRLGARADSLQETAKALRYDPLAWKLYAFVILALLPRSFRFRMFQRSAASLFAGQERRNC